MTNFHNVQIPPPKYWQDFEDLCCDLWKKIWGDSNTQKNGRNGQAQHGVDIFGMTRSGGWGGVQCKGKDIYSNNCLSETELREEIEKAKKFKPHLSQFIIATSGKKDANVEKVAREISEEHISLNLFSVTVWGWDDIVLSLGNHESVKTKHYDWIFSKIKNNISKTEDVDCHNIPWSLPEEVLETIRNTKGVLAASVIGSSHEKDDPRDIDLFILCHDEKTRCALYKHASSWQINMPISAADAPSHWVQTGMDGQLLHLIVHSEDDLKRLDLFYRWELIRALQNENTHIFAPTPDKLKRIANEYKEDQSIQTLIDSILSQGFGLETLEHVLRDGFLSFQDPILNHHDGVLNLCKDGYLTQQGQEILLYLLHSILARVMTCMTAAKCTNSTHSFSKKAINTFNQYYHYKADRLFDEFSELVKDLELIGDGYIRVPKEIKLTRPRLEKTIQTIFEGDKAYGLLTRQKAVGTSWKSLCIGISEMCTQVRRILGVLSFWGNKLGDSKFQSHTIIAGHPTDRHAAVMSILSIYQPNTTSILLPFLAAHHPGESYPSGISSIFEPQLFRYHLSSQINNFNDYIDRLKKVRKQNVKWAMEALAEIGNIIHKVAGKGWTKEEIDSGVQEWLERLNDVLNTITSSSDPYADTYRHHSFILSMAETYTKYGGDIPTELFKFIRSYLYRFNCDPILYWLETLSIPSSYLDSEEKFRIWYEKTTSGFAITTSGELANLLRIKSLQILLKWYMRALGAPTLTKISIQHFSFFGFRAGHILALNRKDTELDTDLNAIRSELRNRLGQHAFQTLLAGASKNSEWTHAAEWLLRSLCKVAPVTTSGLLRTSSQYGIGTSHEGVVIENPKLLSTPLDENIQAWQVLDSKNSSEKGKRLLSRLAQTAQIALDTKVLREQTRLMGTMVSDVNTWSIETEKMQHSTSLHTGSQYPDRDFLQLVFPLTQSLCPNSKDTITSMPFHYMIVLEIVVPKGNIRDAHSCYAELFQGIGILWKCLYQQE